MLARCYHRDLADVVEMHTERAAIREYDGGMGRGDADREALLDVERVLCAIPVQGSSDGES